MDPKLPTELSTEKVPEEEVLKEEILIPREISSALGRGLRQSFTQSLQQIKSETEKLGDIKWIDQIKTSQEGIESLLRRLEFAKETRLVPKGKGNGDPGDHFEFSEETVEEKPKAGTLTTDTMTLPIIKAMTHMFNNLLSPVQGYSELIEKDVKNEERVRNSGRLMKETALQIAKKLNSLNNAGNIKLLTDDNGETSVLPLHFTRTSG